MLITGHRTLQIGTTLIELMIGSALGLIVLSGIIAFYVDTAQKNATGLAQLHLNHDLDAVLLLMTRDIRRAGYWNARPGHTAMGNNPFNLPDNVLQIAGFRREPANSCILFSYDLNSDGKMGIGSTKISNALYSNVNQERFGYRLRKGAVQMHSGGRHLDCNTDVWQSITEPSVTIEHLNFSLTEDCLNLLDKDIACRASAPVLFTRKVEVRLSGHLTSNPQVTASLADIVYVRNHSYRAAQP